ncbi:MAG: hypothetical protein AB7F96_07765 [Beijerinckiaceae bacterium]
MNSDLADCLDRSGIAYETLSKAQKVKLLARWASEFSHLCSRARHGIDAPDVLAGNHAQEQMRALAADSFHVLPDDASDMPSLLCRHASVPDLSALVSDTFAKCEEIVIVDAGFEWSCVLVNHGAAGPGWYFMRAGN